MFVDRLHECRRQAIIAAAVPSASRRRLEHRHDFSPTVNPSVTLEPQVLRTGIERAAQYGITTIDMGDQGSEQ